MFHSQYFGFQFPNVKEREKKRGAREGEQTNYSVVILMPRQNLLLNESIKPPVLKLSNINSDSVKINFSSSGQSQTQYCLLNKFLMFQNYTDIPEKIHTIYIQYIWSYNKDGKGR